jgi:hypothetical protein
MDSRKSRLRRLETLVAKNKDRIGAGPAFDWTPLPRDWTTLDLATLDDRWRSRVEEARRTTKAAVGSRPRRCEIEDLLDGPLPPLEAES